MNRRKTVMLSPAGSRVTVTSAGPRGPMPMSERQQLAEATRLAREIHRHLKRGESTPDHGLVGNLKCVLDHVSSEGMPEPLV